MDLTSEVVSSVKSISDEGKIHSKVVRGESERGGKNRSWHHHYCDSEREFILRKNEKAVSPPFLTLGFYVHF